MLARAMRWPYARVLKTMPPIHRKVMGDVMSFISKLDDPDAQGSPIADPTDETEPTSTALNDGTRSSPNSATTSS